MKQIFQVFAALISCGAAFGQIPHCNAITGWQQQGKTRTYDVSNLFEYVKGNSEGYFIYSFVVMNGITCQLGENTIVIDISEFTNPEYAYGMFTSTRDPRLPAEKIGVSGQVTPRKIIFVKDKFYVELGANPEKDFTQELRTYALIIERSISGQTMIPEIISWFPKQDLAGENSVRLIPESVLGLRLLKSGYVAQYDFGKGFIVSEVSAEAAVELMSKLRQRFHEIRPVTIADEAFTATDKYLNGICIFRKGSYVAGFVDLKVSRDGIAESTKLAGSIR